jgi:hypothetical protein
MPTEINDDVIEAHVDEDDDDTDEEKAIPSADAIEDEEDDDDEETSVVNDVEMVVDDDDAKDDDDVEEVLAAVVAEDEDNEAAEDSIDDDDLVDDEPVVAVVETPKRKAGSSNKAFDSSTRMQQKVISNSTKHLSPNTASKNVATAETRNVVNANKRQNVGYSKATIVTDPVYDLLKSLPAKKVSSAKEAGSILRETVQTLPVTVADIQVRSFGQLCIQSIPNESSNAPSLAKNPFYTATALYPIGFSCDRYELSPVHGRMLKIRCTILDGRSIKAKQKFRGLPMQTDLPDGPVFRIMWGRGIDEESPSTTDAEIDNTFDPLVHSKPIVSTGSVKIDALILDTLKATKKATVVPKAGMHVKVWCNKEIFFPGVIGAVSEANTTDCRKERKQYDIIIVYEDGLQEEMSFPDPDVEIVMPGKH